MLLNSHKDQRTGDKLVKRFIGSYAVEEYVGKGIEHSWNRESTGRPKELHPRKVWFQI